MEGGEGVREEESSLAILKSTVDYLGYYYRYYYCYYYFFTIICLKKI